MPNAPMTTTLKVGIFEVVVDDELHNDAETMGASALWGHHQKCPKQGRHRHFAKADQDGSITRDTLSASCKVASRP
jgi:hypothetical protein